MRDSLSCAASDFRGGAVFIRFLESIPALSVPQTSSAGTRALRFYGCGGSAQERAKAVHLKRAQLASARRGLRALNPCVCSTRASKGGAPEASAARFSAPPVASAQTKRETGLEPATFSLGTPGLPIESPVNLATSDAPRVRLHTGLHKAAHDRDSRPRARPATFAHGRPGPALAPIPGRRQSVRRRANVAGRGRLHVYAYRIRDVAAVGGDSVDVDARMPRRRYLAGDGRTRCLREQPRG